MKLCSVICVAQTFDGINHLRNYINRSLVKVPIMSLLYNARAQSQIEKMRESFIKQTLMDDIILSKTELNLARKVFGLFCSWINIFVKNKIPEALLLSNIIKFGCKHKTFIPPVLKNERHMSYLYWPCVKEKYTKSIRNRDYSLIKDKSSLDWAKLSTAYIANYVQYQDAKLLEYIVHECNLANIWYIQLMILFLSCK